MDGPLRVECEDKDGDSYVEEAIWMYMYEKNNDYHNAFDGDRFKRWIESFYLPAWHAMYPGTPPILVLDNCPSHIVGMTNPLSMPNKTVCTDAIRDVVKSLGRRKHDVVVMRDGEVCVFPLQKRGEDFARAPAGPSLDELRQEVLKLFKEHKPEALKTWVEVELEKEKEGGEAIFTPPGLCVFQPIELYWADTGHLDVLDTHENEQQHCIIRT